jgi:hypothetical protein
MEELSAVADKAFLPFAKDISPVKISHTKTT